MDKEPRVERNQGPLPSDDSWHVTEYIELDHTCTVCVF